MIEENRRREPSLFSNNSPTATRAPNTDGKVVDETTSNPANCFASKTDLSFTLVGLLSSLLWMFISGGMVTVTGHHKSDTLALATLRVETVSSNDLLFYVERQAVSEGNDEDSAE
jgi:hypothetical protein